MNAAEPYQSSSSSTPAASSSSAAKSPLNLRFQRRTSERAYLEGAYRDGSVTSPSSNPATMDYSASADYAGGSSPWANSPEVSRQTFGDAAISRENLPPPAVEENGESRESWSEEQQQQWRAQSQGQGQDQGQQQQPQVSGQQRGNGEGEENRRPHSAARYHGAPAHQPHQRQPMPQYKLQAKITGLERTGKKDPILRFDVYVCPSIRRDLLKISTNCLSDQSAEIPNYSIPRHQTYSFRVSEAVLPPASLESGSSSTCSPTCVHLCRYGHG